MARKTGSQIEEWQVVARCRVRTREGGCKDWGGRRSHKKGRERGSGTEERGQGRKKREVGEGRGRGRESANYTRKTTVNRAKSR